MYLCAIDVDSPYLPQLRALYERSFPANERRTLEDLFAQIQEGEIVGVVGESGSGKSMTAMAIAGLLRRHDMEKKGEIIFEGKELLHASRAEVREYQGDDIGMIFQEPMTSLNPVFTIGQQLDEVTFIHKPDATKEELVELAYEEFRMTVESN